MKSEVKQLKFNLKNAESTC